MAESSVVFPACPCPTIATLRMFSPVYTFTRSAPSRACKMKRGGQEENQQIQNGQPYTTRQNLGCYHAASGSLNPRSKCRDSRPRLLVERTSTLYLPPGQQPGPVCRANSLSADVSSRHARQPHQLPVDRAILFQPSEPHKPRLPHSWHSYHPAFPAAFHCQHLSPSLMALRDRPLHCRLDLSIRRPCLRRQSSGVLPRLAILICRRPLVVGENPWQSIGRMQRFPQYILPAIWRSGVLPKARVFTSGPRDLPGPAGSYGTH